MNNSFDLGPQDILSLGLISQIHSLDFARRYFSKDDKKTSKRRSNEIEKGLEKILDISTSLYRAHISEDILAKQMLFEIKEKRSSNNHNITKKSRGK